MKKALVVLLALTCLGAAAFADGPTAAWTVTGLYGFGVYMPSSGNVILPYDYSQVGTNRTRLDFKYTSADGNAGFLTETQYVGILAGGTGTLNFPRWNVWGKLFNGLLTIKGGQGDDYGVATKDWNVYGSTDGENAVGPGISFMLTPITGLNILFFQKIPAVSSPMNLDGDLVGASFTMPNLVSVQAGVNLLSTQSASTGNKVYFGLSVTAIPDLTAILEGQASLFTGQTPIQLNQYIAYTMGPLTVGARIGEYLDSAVTDWGIEPTVTFKVDGNFALNAIVNVYQYDNRPYRVSAGNPTGNTVGAVTFMSPIDAGAVGAGNANTMNFGLGASATYTLSGFTLTVGDDYGAGNASGNIIYVNADVTL
jgi:hypothetical protein